MELKECIDDIRDRLKNQEYPNEQSIRQCIVDPILNALGWSTLDPESVYPEYPVKGIGEVDYALCYPALEPCVFIEVKQLYGALTEAKGQLLGYTTRRSVPIGVLTDGERWRFFHSAGESAQKTRKVQALNLNIDDTSVNLKALKKYLSYEAIKTGSAHKAMKQDAEKRHIEKHLPDAWEIARYCWDEEKKISKQDLAADLNIKVTDIDAIRNSKAYLAAVEKLIMTTRSREKIIKWIKPRKSSDFGKHMGLPTADASQLFQKVLENLSAA